MVDSSNYRIRQVAIAIQGMDAELAKRLLDHFPPSIARQIHEYALSLGPISPSEHEQAIQTIALLLANEPEENDLSKISGSSPIEFLESKPISILAASLQDERPIVIAAILRHLPTTLGQAILPCIPIETAKASIEWIPKLSEMQPGVLDQLMRAWQSRVEVATLAVETKEQTEEKVRELLQALPAETPLSSTSEETGVPPKPASFAPSSPVVSIPIATLQSQSFETRPSPDKRSPSEPFIISLASKRSRSEMTDELLQLDDLDLLQVLYTIRPENLRAFLAGAGKKMRTRIEQLTAPKHLRKLRREIGNLPQTDERAWRAIASELIEKALEISRYPGMSPSVGTDPHSQTRIPA